MAIELEERSHPTQLFVLSGRRTNIFRPSGSEAKDYSSYACDVVDSVNHTINNLDRLLWEENQNSFHGGGLAELILDDRCSSQPVADAACPPKVGARKASQSPRWPPLWAWEDPAPWSCLCVGSLLPRRRRPVPEEFEFCEVVPHKPGNRGKYPPPNPQIGAQSWSIRSWSV